MTPRGGAREGAGRPPRTEPKARAIWCGQMGEDDRRLILATLTPAERLDALLDAVFIKLDVMQKGERMMDWKQRTRISKAELGQLDSEAVSVTSLSSSFGTYDAIVTMPDGAEFRVTTESLNPDGDVQIRSVDRATADRLMAN